MNWFFHRRLCLYANQLVLTGESHVTEELRDKLVAMWFKCAQAEAPECR